MKKYNHNYIQKKKNNFTNIFYYITDIVCLYPPTKHSLNLMCDLLL